MTDTRNSGESTDLAEKPRQSVREDRLLAALASGASVADSARQAAMSPRSVHRRLANPAFRAELQQIRSRLVDAALSKLVGSLGTAADTLRDLMASESDSIRLSAAKSVFETVCRLREQTEFENRLADLEEAQRVNAQKQT